MPDGARSPSALSPSALSPREIQTRVRSGASVADIVSETGMDAARVEAFAVPVIAEREFIAAQARSHVARRGGETIAHRTLAQVVADRLSPRGIDPEAVQWDAWRVEGRRWAVQAAWESAGSQHDARFAYDQAGRFSVADNDDASWLLGIHSPAAEPALGEEAEPTVGLNDDLALVRVVQPGVPFEDTAPIEPDPADADTDPDTAVADAYTEGELEEVDGVYDIVTDTTGGIDVLYDMLAGFDEDSVQIYSGLVRPDAGSPATPVVVDEQPEPEQHSLFEEAPQATEATAKPAKRRKRAHVPSWDEIVFGSPSPRKGGGPKGE